MARYRKANPLIWDQAVMVDGSDLDRSVWMLLHLGPQVTNLPGLFMATGASLADILRRDRAEVEETLLHFEGLGLIQRDERARVMRLVQVWAEHAPENLNVLKGWLTTYQDIPESPCKVAHLATLRDLTGPKLREDFTKLFGAATETPVAGFPKPPSQGSRNPRRRVPETPVNATRGGSRTKEQEQEQIQIKPDPAASALDLSKPHAGGREASTAEPLDADDPPAHHPRQLALYARLGIPLTVLGETKAQGQARRQAALAAALDAQADPRPNPGSSGRGEGEEDHDPEPPSGRPDAPPADSLAPALGLPEDAPSPPATGVGSPASPPALGAALAGPGEHVPVAGEEWPPPAGWIPLPGSIMQTCGACSMGRRYPEALLCPCPLGVGEGKRRVRAAALDAEEARERAERAERRAAKTSGPPLFGAETPAEQAALTAPSTTPLGKLGLASLLPPPGYGAKVPDDPAALILATLERQPEPLRFLADPGVATRLAGAVMGTKATVAQIEDAIRTASAKLPRELGQVRADDQTGVDRVQRWLAGCLKGCRNQGAGRAAPHDPSEALPVVTRRILARFAAAYADREGIDYLAGEEDPAHAETLAAHLKRQVEAAAQKAGAAPDAALGGAMLDQLLETWLASKMGEATGYALAQLAGALRREPARWAYRPAPPDPYAGVHLDHDAPVGPRPPVVPRAAKPRPELAAVVQLFDRKRDTA